LEFSGEGDPAWVAEQFDKFVKEAPKLLSIPAAESSSGGGHQPMAANPAVASKPLATFLKDKSANDNQTKKFLATAAWLEAKGKKRLVTGDVVQALKDNNQAGLGNPSQCLAYNVQQGHCERDGDKFFVTDEGAQSL
jgi:hypothetical protein